MSSFKRSIQRNQKNETTFHKKEKPKPQSFFKQNFTFGWIPNQNSSLFMIIVVLLFTQFACFPVLRNTFQPLIALVLTHTFLTSLLLILSFRLTTEEKVPITAWLLRYCFFALLCGAVSLVLGGLFLL